jgi:dTDP-4-dehydrorhamnose reductase
MKNNEQVFLVTGAKGLLGRYFVEVLTTSIKKFFEFDKSELDVTNQDLIEAVVDRIKATHIIN